MCLDALFHITITRILESESCLVFFFFFFFFFLSGSGKLANLCQIVITLELQLYLHICIPAIILLKLLSDWISVGPITVYRRFK